MVGCEDRDGDFLWQMPEHLKRISRSDRIPQATHCRLGNEVADGLHNLFLNDFVVAGQSRSHVMLQHVCDRAMQSEGVHSFVGR